MGANTPRNTRSHTLMGGTEFSFHVALKPRGESVNSVQEEASFNPYLETTYTMHPVSNLSFLWPQALNPHPVYDLVHFQSRTPLLPFHTSGVTTNGSAWSACCPFHVIAQLTAVLLS